MSRLTGVVRYYDKGKGYGFITESTHPDDVFFHVTDVETIESYIRVSATVDFYVELTSKGPKATRVRVRGAPSVARRDDRFNGIRLPQRPLHMEITPPHFGTETLPDGTHAKVAALLDFSGPQRTPFSIGAVLSKDEAFRAAVRDLYASIKGSRVAGPSRLLVVSVAKVLSGYSAAQEPRLTNYLKAALRILSPLFRLVMSGERRETHAAVEEVLARYVRLALVATASTTSAADHGPHAAPSEPVTEAETGSPSPDAAVASAGPGVVEPATRPLVAAVAQRLNEALAAELAPARTAVTRLDDALGRARANPFDREPLDALISVLQESASALSAALKGVTPLADPLAAGNPPLSEVLAELDQLIGGCEVAVEEWAPELVIPGLAREVRRLAIVVQATRESGLPPWARQQLLGEHGDAQPHLALRHLQAVPLAAESAAVCAEWAKGLSPQARELLDSLDPPAATDPTPAPLLDQLQSALASAMQASRENAALAARLAAGGDLLNPCLLEQLRGERARTDVLDQAEALIHRVRALQEHLEVKAFDELCASVRRWPDDRGCEQMLEDVESAVALIGGDVSRFIPSLSSLLESARRRAGASEQRQAAPRAQPPGPFGEISIDHPLSKGVGGVYRASLAWSEQRGQGFGVVAFPIRLKSSAPPAKPVACMLKVKSDRLLGSNPREWDVPYPPEIPLMWPAGEKRLDVALLLPVRKPLAQSISAENQNVSLQLTVSVGDRNWTGTLDWQGLALSLPVYQSPFSQTITPREMEDRPLGVEWHFKSLVSLIEQGRKSFRVHGPRRFGKTTLIHAVSARFKQSPTIAVLDRVVASEKDSASEVWAEVVGNLQQRFDRPITLTMSDSGVPARHVLNSVRQKARQMGYSAIYVLIDEAQALFASQAERGAPGKYGIALKRMLESEWGVPTEHEVPLLLGLVGQAHLPSLMGADLLGAISDEYSASTMNPDELLGLLRSTGGIGLQSTAEARATLARQAGNFWILDRLLRRIADSCSDEGRAWFMESDVARAVERLVQDDQDGLDQTLWSYVRDVLSESDNRNVWVPSEAFPVAMAWAFMRSLGATGDPLQDTMDALEDWANEAEITINNGVIAEVLQTLKEQRIIRKDGSFELPLLEALLAARANDHPFRDPAERRSLVRLGLQRVRAPDTRPGAEHFEGGQASIQRAQKDGLDLAVRRVRLVNPAAEQRFAREVSLLQKVWGTQGEHSSAGRQHLPVLKEAGLDARSSGIGIVLYEWVEGAALQHGQLDSRRALTVLSGLAEALGLLRHVPPSGIVHRDIKPDNVIIRSADGEPVLVDFGLSIAVDDVAKTTVVAGALDFIPPEVKESDSKAWTPAGDVFSLGKTVLACLGQEGERDAELIDLLGRMTSRDPSARPTPEDILQASKDMLLRREIHDREARFTSIFDEAVRRLPAYAQDAVKGQRHDFVAAVKGDSRERVTLPQVAEFLENLVQAFVRKTHPSLARRVQEEGKSTLLIWLSSPDKEAPLELRPLAIAASRAVGLLRNAAAHGAEYARIYSEACRVLGGPSGKTAGAPQLREAEIAVAREVGRLFGVPELVALVERWIAS